VKRLAAVINNRTLRTRMIAVCLLIAVSSTGLMAFFSYSRASELVQNQAYHEASNTVNQAAINLNDRLRNVLSQVINLETSSRDPIIEAISDEGNLTNSDHARISSLLQPGLASVRLREPLILSAYIYHPTYQYYDFLVQPNPDFIHTRTYQEAEQIKTEDRFLTPRLDEVFGSGKRVIPLVVPFNLFNQVVSSDDRNFLLINLDESAILAYLQSLNLSRQSMIYIATTQGQPFSWSESRYQNLLHSPDFQARLNSERQLPKNFEYGQGDQVLYINYADLGINDWKIVSLQLKSELLAGLGDIQRFTMLVGFICLLLSLVLSSWLAATITRPIGVLQNLMRRAEVGDFATPFNSSAKNEIGDLGQSFNSMIEQIQQLLAQVKTEQSAKRLAELRALQAQINPHFLYNTLDSIYWKAMMKETEAVSEMAVSLSNLFRLGLNSGYEITTVAKELEHVRNYLEIQQLCYGDTFTYSIKVEPGVAELKVVKLILQPLVENSLLHGFAALQGKEGRSARGQIEIAACFDSTTSQLCLSVCDNGGGFDIAELREKLAHSEIGSETGPEGEHGYALRNVHARLQLHYGPAYRLEMASRPYERTCLEIRVPGQAEPTAQDSLPIEQKSPINIIR